MNIVKVLAAIILISFNFNCYAAPLYIEVTGGQSTGLPIAVIPFSSGNNDVLLSAYTDQLGKIIRQNLQNSGQFKPLPVKHMHRQETLDKPIDVEYWRQSGIEYLVAGSVKQNTDGLYTVDFKLFNLYAHKSAKSANEISKVRFENINPNNIRELAHQISDQIFLQILGVKGFFSTRIAYVSIQKDPETAVKKYLLQVADADGFNAKTVYSSDLPIMSPSWSPDGRNIAFVSFAGKRSKIYVLNLITSKLDVITDYPGINGEPAWSPDGNKLALVLSKSGAPKIYLYDFARNELEQLTFGYAIDTEPKFSGDGNSIVFTSNRGGKPQIYQVSLVGQRDVQRLTFDGAYNASPVLTPDGKRLVMMHQNSNGDFSIAVQDLANGKVRILTNTRSDETPSLAPNGMMVIYGTQEAGRGVLGAVSLDGRFRIRIPIPEGSVKSPAWSPFLT